MTKADLVEQVTAVHRPHRRADDLQEGLRPRGGRVPRRGQGGAQGRSTTSRSAGFGTFKIRRRKTRMARNPRTGDPVEVAARPVPVFKPSKELRALVADEPEPIPSRQR